ncbi:MAG: ankyrin repeat domain-containing protein [Candidatus Hydrogenedentes bacterium]|nr:ankyrin repeat domain-containing protein [Candidatus Hydrogenedentota bacterium]
MTRVLKSECFGGGPVTAGVVMKDKFTHILLLIALVSTAGCTGPGQETPSVAEKYGPVPTEIGASGEEGQLLLAIRNGDVDTVSRFLDADKSPDSRIDIAYTWGEAVLIPDREDEQPMSAMPAFKTVWRNLKVCHRRPTLLEEAVRADQVSVARLLIERGADVNLPNEPGKDTPLMYAAMRKEPALVKLLIDNGASPFPANTAGETSLVLAERTGHPKNVALLKKAGATK